MKQNQYYVCSPESVEQICAYHQLRYQELRAPWRQEKGSEVDELESVAVHRMVCAENGDVVAVGRLHKVSTTHAQIRFMAVDSKHQGQGLGNLVLAALEQEAVRQGVTQIDLNARDVALGFYQANDYQLVKEAHTLYGAVKHFSMVKPLSANKNQHHTWLCELEQTWHRTIPASKAMLIHPSFYNAQEFVVCADRAANINLHNTMFAGSIYTLATLTGWGWVHLLLKQHGLQADIVLADADIKYKSPLKGQPLAKTNIDLTAANLSGLTRGRKARVNVQVNIHDGDKIVAIFNGKYVAIPIDE